MGSVRRVLSQAGDAAGTASARGSVLLILAVLAVFGLTVARPTVLRYSRYSEYEKVLDTREYTGNICRNFE